MRSRAARTTRGCASPQNAASPSAAAGGAPRPALRGLRRKRLEIRRRTLMRSNFGINPPCKTEIRGQRPTAVLNRQVIPSRTPGFLHSISHGNDEVGVRFGITHCFFLACQPPQQDLDVAKKEPCLGCRDSRLEVFGQLPVAAQPRQRPLHRPALRRHLEPPPGRCAFHDLEPPTPLALESRRQFRTRIGTIGKNVAQPRKPMPDQG